MSRIQPPPTRLLRHILTRRIQTFTISRNRQRTLRHIRRKPNNNIKILRHNRRKLTRNKIVNRIRTILSLTMRTHNLLLPPTVKRLTGTTRNTKRTLNRLNRHTSNKTTTSVILSHLRPLTPRLKTRIIRTSTRRPIFHRHHRMRNSRPPTQNTSSHHLNRPRVVRRHRHIHTLSQSNVNLHPHPDQLTTTTVIRTSRPTINRHQHRMVRVIRTTNRPNRTRSQRTHTLVPVNRANTIKHNRRLHFRSNPLSILRRCPKLIDTQAVIR